MYGYIYKFTNRINGKSYVGQRKHNGIDQNYFGSGILFAKAKNKYGIENFKFDILCFVNSLEEANEKELYYIKSLDTLNPNGYNIQLGGNVGNSYTGKTEEEMEEIRKKLKARSKAMWENEEYRNKLIQIRKGVNPYSGKTKEEMNKHKEKCSKSQKEFWKNKTDEDRKKVGERLKLANKGVPKSTNHRKKISEKLTNNPKKCKKVFCVETGVIYPSLREVERQTGLNHAIISKCCRGIKESAGEDEQGNKLHWRYL